MDLLLFALAYSTALSAIALHKRPAPSPKTPEPIVMRREPGTGYQTTLASGVNFQAVMTESLDLLVTAYGWTPAGPRYGARVQFTWPDSGPAFFRHAGGFQIPISAIEEAERRLL